MRKNGVNKELRPILGGVCAPSGFRASGVAAGILEADKRDLAFILSEKLCSTACVYATGLLLGATAKITKKHLKNGLAQAVLVHSGIANVYQNDGERMAEYICSLLEKPFGVAAEDVVIASTGTIGKPLPVHAIEKGIGLLAGGLEATNEGSLRAAEAIMTTDRSCKQFAYEFDLGDFPCKIGVICKGNARVCPNMATTLAFLTTDVNVSTEMLQKALNAAVNDTLNMLNLDGIASPNDTVCVMANGRAGNYRISEPDTEYQKFVFALKKVLETVCRQIARDGDGKLLVCKAYGAKSKQIARAVSRSLVEIYGARNVGQRFQTESLVYAVASARNTDDLSKARIFMQTETLRVSVMEAGRPLILSTTAAETLGQANELEIHVDFGEGNYSAVAFGRME